MSNPPEKVDARPAGTLADITEGVDFTRTFTYFEDEHVAQAFAEMGVRPIEPMLPKCLMVSDWGAGTGMMLSVVANYLSQRGHDTTPLAVDLNPTLLAHAREKGMDILEADLQTLAISPRQHLIIMRGSLQYNDTPAQVDILRNVYDSLEDQGILVVQLSSGSPENIALRRTILDHPLLGEVYGSGNRHYTTTEQHLDLCQQAGFGHNYVLPQHAPPLHWTTEQMWQRRNAHKLEEAQKAGDQQAVATIEAHHKQFIQETNQLIETAITQAQENGTLNRLGIIRGKNGEYIIEVTYPIIISSKSEIPQLSNYQKG